MPFYYLKLLVWMFAHFFHFAASSLLSYGALNSKLQVKDSDLAYFFEPHQIFWQKATFTIYTFFTSLGPSSNGNFKDLGAKQWLSTSCWNRQDIPTASDLGRTFSSWTRSQVSIIVNKWQCWRPGLLADSLNAISQHLCSTFVAAMFCPYISRYVQQLSYGKVQRI